MKKRHEILNDALRLRDEARQILHDFEHWNLQVRKPDEAIIDGDPDGSLGRLIQGVENGLRKELLCVHVLGPDDLLAAASLEDAEKQAEALNRYFETELEKTEHTPEMRAVVEAWPYDAAGHADSLAKQASELALQKAESGKGDER